MSEGAAPDTGLWRDALAQVDSFPNIDRLRLRWSRPSERARGCTARRWFASASSRRRAAESLIKG